VVERVVGGRDLVCSNNPTGEPDEAPHSVVQLRGKPLAQRTSPLQSGRDGATAQRLDLTKDTDKVRLSCAHSWLLRLGDVLVKLVGYSSSRFRQNFVLKFLREERQRVRAVEVKRLRVDNSRDQSVVGSRKWQPVDDLVSTAKEIAKYPTENEPAEATIVIPDEI
jgi:hypothetical protein